MRIVDQDWGTGSPTFRLKWSASRGSTPASRKSQEPTRDKNDLIKKLSEGGTLVKEKKEGKGPRGRPANSPSGQGSLR